MSTHLYPWCYVEVSDQLHAPVALPLGKNPTMHLTGGCVDPRADIDILSKINYPFSASI